MNNGHFIGLKEAFIPAKGETYLIVSDGWVAKQSVSQKVRVSLSQLNLRWSIGSQCSLDPEWDGDYRCHESLFQSVHQCVIALS